MGQHGPLLRLKSAARCALRPQLAEGLRRQALTATVVEAVMATGIDADGEALT